MPNIDHLALAVQNPARSLAFYREAIGVEGSVREEEYGFVIATPNGVSFTLLEGTPPTAMGEFHIGVCLPDETSVRVRRAELLARGVREIEWSEEPGYVAVKVADPDGYIVELVWDSHILAE